MEFPLQLKAYADRVDLRLAELLPPPSDPPACLREAMSYSALAPGKRIRPCLTLIAAEAVGGHMDDALDAACAIEFVHAFSLVHDDLPALDNDDLRRGRPTCHKVYGEAIAILAGDALFALAFDILSGLAITPDRSVKAMRSLSRATGLLVAGETTDIISEGQDVPFEVVQRIHQQKTGALIAAAAEIGGIMGGGDYSQIQALHRYGEFVGLAFQIADDVLNETGTAEQLGKAAGSDRDRKKATYPSVYGVDVSREIAIAAVKSGIDALESIPKRELLAELAHFSVSRLS